MFLIYAEDDCLLHAVATFLEELCDALGNQFGAIVDHQSAVEILGVVDAVFDLVPVPVKLAFSPRRSVFANPIRPPRSLE
jgi:hypothetical protein